MPKKCLLCFGCHLFNTTTKILWLLLARNINCIQANCVQPERRKNLVLFLTRSWTWNTLGNTLNGAACAFSDHVQICLGLLQLISSQMVIASSNKQKWQQAAAYFICYLLEHNDICKCHQLLLKIREASVTDVCFSPWHVHKLDIYKLAGDKSIQWLSCNLFWIPL